MAAAAELPLCRRSALQVMDKIGRGSFGAVYKCIFRGRICALKELNLTNTSVSHHWIRERLRKEIDVLHSVSSESQAFVRTLATCTNDQGDVTGYVMEYFALGNMRACFNRLKSFNLDCQNFPWLALHLLRQVAAGLRFLQEERAQVILHKDVAIDNVFVSASMDAKLGDFGLARGLSDALGQDTQQFESLIGIERRPPELLREPIRPPDVFVDRYLFGVCLFEALTCSSLRHRIGEGIADYRALVTSGRHVDSLVEAVERDCFSAYPTRLRDPAAAEFEHMRSAAMDALRGCLATEPSQRPTFSWLCDRLAEAADCGETKREVGLAIVLLAPQPAAGGGGAAAALPPPSRTSAANLVGGDRRAVRTTDDSLESLLQPHQRDSGLSSAAGAASPAALTLNLDNCGEGVGRGSVRVGVVDGRVYNLSAAAAPAVATRRHFAHKPAPQPMLTAIFRTSDLRDAWPRVLEALGAPVEAVSEAALAARRAGRRDAEAALETLDLLLPPPTVRQLADGLTEARCSGALRLLTRLQEKYCSPVTSSTTSSATVESADSMLRVAL